jgi:6-phosphogluconolactonase
VRVYIGSYTSNGGEGIYRFDLDPETGSLAWAETLAGVINPSYLLFSRDGRYLYCVNEVDSYYGRREGALSAFAVEPGTGHLRFLNQQPSGGAGPCHLSLDRGGRFLLAANYGGGTVAVFPLQPDGRLGAAACTVRHEGHGPNPNRQEAPHPHCTAPDPFNRHVLAVDLGIDKVMAYAFDGTSGALRPAAVPFAACRPGSGPRHLAFHPDGRRAYLVHELESIVRHCAYDGKTGALSEVASHSTLPAGHAGENYPSGIEIDGNARFLYVGNRGHDSIVHFRMGPEGDLAFAGSASTRGKFPRHFTLAPGGRLLLAANQRSDSVQVFRIDPEDGSLHWTGHQAHVPAPVCVRIADPAQR